METWTKKTEYENTISYERQVGKLYQSIELEKDFIKEIIKDAIYERNRKNYQIGRIQPMF